MLGLKISLPFSAKRYGKAYQILLDGQFSSNSLEQSYLNFSNQPLF